MKEEVMEIVVKVLGVILMIFGILQLVGLK